MRYTVKLMPRALRQLDAVASWWRVNRTEAPELAREEVLAVLASLDLNPGRGMHAKSRPHVRMLLARRTGLLVLYRVRERARRVEVVEIRRP